MNWESIRKEFPLIYNNYKKLIYFDNAATSQKPKKFLIALKNYYSNLNSNIHRGNYYISQESEKLYENFDPYRIKHIESLFIVIKNVQNHCDSITKYNVPIEEVFIFEEEF